MSKSKHYKELAVEVMETAWDIQDAIDGTNNHFNKDEMIGLKHLKEQCELFIRCYNDYVTETKAQ